MKFGKSLSRKLKQRKEKTRKHSIFVVDDEPYILQTLKDLLESHHYDVETCNSGDQALQRLMERQLEKRPFKVIISDQRMPGVKGVDVLKEALSLFPQTKRILYTAYTDVDAIIDSINSAQVYRFLRKQGEDEDLLLTLRRAVEAYDVETAHENLMSELDQRVKEKTRELEKKTLELAEKNAELEQLNSSKNRLFSILSHDLRGPFQNFLGGFEEFSNLDDFTVEEVEEMAGHMHQIATNLFYMLDNLLNWSQLQFNELKPGAESFFPHKVAQQVIETNRGIALNKEVSVFNQIPGALQWETDPNMVMIILHNLVANALKFCRPGDTVSINAALSARKELILEVKDTGIGIPPTTLQLLFNKQVRPIRSGTKQEKGVGLGLTICHELTDLLHGRIEVDSQLDVGSEFRIVLPDFSKVRNEDFKKRSEVITNEVVGESLSGEMTPPNTPAFATPVNESTREPVHDTIEILEEINH